MKKFLPPYNVLYLLSVFVVTLLYFQVCRSLMLVYFADLARSIPEKTLAMAFLIGLRFDMVIACYGIAFAFILMHFPGKIAKTLGKYSMLFAFSLFLFLLISEIGFFEEYRTRLDYTYFEYFDKPEIVLPMLWQGYPVFKYLTFIALFLFSYLGILRLIEKKLRAFSSQNHTAWFQRVSYAAVCSGLIFIGARGSIGIGQLNWGDAYFSNFTFANQLALNGVYTLIRSTKYELESQRAEQFLDFYDIAQAISTVRQQTKMDHETFSTPQTLLVRSHTFQEPATPYNVVVILLESFTAKHVGILQGEMNLTPEFDALAREGILFRKFFSTGVRTNRALPSTFCGFPNLPGASVMKRSEGQQYFHSLANILKPYGYTSLFVYGGDLEFDNMHGFLRNIGFEQFVDYTQYDQSQFLTKWGATDEQVFIKANELFRQQQGPFFGAILTLSNHSPYLVPESADFERVDASVKDANILNAFKYSDYALGQFFKLARQETYFENTIFIVLGDHGKAYKGAEYALNLDRFQVPLLLYAPGILEPGVQNVIGSQVDILPTIMGLLKFNYTHASFGRDLLKLNEDEGFAILVSDQQIGIINHSHYLIEDLGVNTSLYNYRVPQRRTINLMGTSAEIQQIADEMQTTMRSHLQTALYLLKSRQCGESPQN